jgi:hypothetical protein
MYMATVTVVVVRLCRNTRVVVAQCHHPSHCYQLDSSPARRPERMSCHCDMYRLELAISYPALLNYVRFC